VFADETIPDTIRGHRLASQLCLAEGLGFQGGETEKAVYADLMMLCWVAGPKVSGRSLLRVSGIRLPARCTFATVFLR
jgi:hypothetical protein